MLLDRESALTLVSVITFLIGIYLLLTTMRGPIPIRRFAIGVACALVGAGISIYQFMHL